MSSIETTNQQNKAQNSPDIEALKKAYYGNGGEERRIVDESSGFRMSRLAIVLGFVVLALVLGAGGILVANPEARAKLNMAFAGNTCGESGTASCISQYVLGPKFALERQWRDEDIAAQAIRGTLELSYEPKDATVELFQIKYKKDGRDWSRKVPGLGETVCTPGADGKPVCETPMKLLSGVQDGVCSEDTPSVELPTVTSVDVDSVRLNFLPIFEVERNDDGVVETAYNYEYRLVFSHDDYESKTVYLSRSAWSFGVGSAYLDWPGLALVPKPETMLDNFVNFRKALWCYMKNGNIEADKVPASVVDALRKEHHFVTIELYDKTESLVLSAEKKDWWEETWEEIQKGDCEQ